MAHLSDDASAGSHRHSRIDELATAAPLPLLQLASRLSPCPMKRPSATRGFHHPARHLPFLSPASPLSSLPESSIATRQPAAISSGHLNRFQPATTCITAIAALRRLPRSCERRRPQPPWSPFLGLPPPAASSISPITNHGTSNDHNHLHRSILTPSSIPNRSYPTVSDYHSR